MLRHFGGKNMFSTSKTLEKANIKSSTINIIEVRNIVKFNF